MNPIDEEVTVSEMSKRLASRNQELVEQASRLEAVLNGIGDGVIVLDLDDNVVTSNPAAEEILADMWGTSQTSPIRELPEALFESLKPEEASSQDGRHTRRFHVGGRVLGSTAAQVKDPSGKILGTVLVLRDVTRESEAETLKDNFIASISHELRTPLTAIKGYSDLLIRLYANDKESNSLRFAKAINHNTSQLMQHINSLIDMTHIQAGDLDLEMGFIDFEGVVIELVNRWRDRMEGKGLELSFNWTGERLPIVGDRDRLYWALHNLFSNAYNYTLSGGKIQILYFRQDNCASFTISDTGVGIAANDMQYLFSRFFRTRNELTFSIPGVGLGLFITRSIIEAHGGEVAVESELNVGSTFSVTIPLNELKLDQS